MNSNSHALFCFQWLAIPFALTHKAVTSISKTAYSDDVGWVGTNNLKADEWLGNWLDSALLLVFGGIPWQVKQQLALH